MRVRTARVSWVLRLVVAVVATGCSTTSSPTQPTTPTTTVTNTLPTNVDAPTPVSPANGSVSSGWPTFTVIDSTRTGKTGALLYRFDVSTTSTFGAITVTGTVPETPDQTSFTPPSGSTPPAPQTALFWRAVAIDQSNALTSPPSAVQSFMYADVPSAAAKIAAQEGFVLWPGQQPTGTLGQATLGENWQVQTLHYVPTNTTFQSPTLEQLQYFDLFDRGFDPQSAINWMNTHGYPSVAQWYPPPEKAVLGFTYVYLAARDKQVQHATWDLVLRVE